MTDTPTVNDVVRRLAELSRMLDNATEEIARLDEAAVRAKGRHMVRFAREFLGQETGSVDARKQTAVLACKDAWLDAEIAEQQVRACRERIRTIRDQIEVGRSLNSAIKAEWSASAVGQS
jgi:phage shock protein A